MHLGSCLLWVVSSKKWKKGYYSCLKCVCVYLHLYSCFFRKGRTWQLLSFHKSSCQLTVRALVNVWHCSTATLVNSAHSKKTELSEVKNGLPCPPCKHERLKHWFAHCLWHSIGLEGAQKTAEQTFSLCSLIPCGFKWKVNCCWPLRSQGSTSWCSSSSDRVYMHVCT